MSTNMPPSRGDDADSHADLRKPFFEGITKDKKVWLSHYMNDYGIKVKPRHHAIKETLDYHSPYSQFRLSPTVEGLLKQQQKEETKALQRLAQTKHLQGQKEDLASPQKKERLGDGTQNSYDDVRSTVPWQQKYHHQLELQQQGYELQEDGTRQTAGAGVNQPQLMYDFTLPTIPRSPLPGDLTKPTFIALTARHWKGVPLPFSDSRFEPFIASNEDTEYMYSTINPFRYFARKKKFPEYNRCPNLPVSRDAMEEVDQAGSWGSVTHSKMPKRGWARRKFPRPPSSFITRLW